MLEPATPAEHNALRMAVWIALGVAVLSALPVGHAVRFTWSKWALLACGTHVQGTVTAVKETVSDEGGLLYTPTFSFVDAAGRSWDVPPPRWAHYHEYHVGDRVPVAYDPNDPRGALVNSFESLFSWAVIVGLVSFLFLLLPSLAAVYYFWKELRQCGASPSPGPSATGASADAR